VDKPREVPRAVIDACVFGHPRQWIAPLIDAAKHGDVDLIWSPVIIAETHRLLTWQWLRRRGGDLSRVSWRACSEAAKDFLHWVRWAFEVVDDRPPDEALWTDRPRDQWDIPLWNAAVRGRADFIVTENLRDGPPPDQDGVRRHGGIVFIHPNDFVQILDNAMEQRTLTVLPGVEEDSPALAPPDEGLPGASPQALGQLRLIREIEHVAAAAVGWRLPFWGLPRRVAHRATGMPVPIG